MTSRCRSAAPDTQADQGKQLSPSFSRYASCSHRTMANAGHRQLLPVLAAIAPLGLASGCSTSPLGPFDGSARRSCQRERPMQQQSLAKQEGSPRAAPVANAPCAPLPPANISQQERASDSTTAEDQATSCIVRCTTPRVGLPTARRELRQAREGATVTESECGRPFPILLRQLALPRRGDKPEQPTRSTDLGTARTFGAGVFSSGAIVEPI